jgi:hypothetical protein
LADYQDEAEKINQGIAEQGGIKADFAPHNNPKGEIFGTPIKVWCRVSALYGSFCCCFC